MFRILVCAFFLLDNPVSLPRYEVGIKHQGVCWWCWDECVVVLRCCWGVGGVVLMWWCCCAAAVMLLVVLQVVLQCRWGWRCYGGARVAIVLWWCVMVLMP